MGRWHKLKSAHVRALRDVITSLTPRTCDDPRGFVESNLSFAANTMAAEKVAHLKLDPHQCEPFDCMFDEPTRAVCMVAPQQVGKSLPWQAALTTWFATMGITAYIIYESDDKAAKVNTDVLKPLMTSVPSLRAQLKMPKTFSKETIRLPNSTVYFQGSGKEAASFAVRVAIGSELDRWDGTEKRRRHILNTLRHRVRRFEKLGMSKFITESSPSTEDGLIWEEFLSYSRGYWHLRCLECGALMRSCDIRHLQWECDEGGEPMNDTIRLVCPECKAEFREADARALNEGGEYVHRYPDRVENRSFQIGALAGFRSITWAKIAETQNKAGKRGGYEAQLDLDNSIRGLPYQQRRKDSEREKALKEHCAPLPTAGNIAAVGMSADTQEDCFYYVVRAIDTKRNTYLLDEGKAPTLQALDDIWNKDYLGGPCDFGIIDRGGRRQRELDPFVDIRDGLWLYKGSNQIGELYQFAKDQERNPFLISAREDHHKAELLYHMYDQECRDDHYWYLPPEDQLTEEYILQMLSVQPNKRVRGGHLHKKWEAPDKVADHLFDAEKMWWVIYHVMLDETAKLIKQAESTARTMDEYRQLEQDAWREAWRKPLEVTE